jgi:hypothetical protein
MQVALCPGLATVSVPIGRLRLAMIKPNRFAVPISSKKTDLLLRLSQPTIAASPYPLNGYSQPFTFAE